MRILLLTIFVVTCCISCNKFNPKEIPQSSFEIINVNIDDAKIFHSSEVFDSISYLKLETTNKNLLGEIKRITRLKDLFFIQCNNGIFVFDNSGKYITKIGEKGEGEGKFRILTDFLIDTLTNTLEILDRKNQKIINFTLGGIFKSEWEHKLNAEAFYKLDNDTYAFYCSNLININNKQDPYRILIVSKRNSDIIAKSIEIDDRLSNFIF